MKADLKLLLVLLLFAAFLFYFRLGDAYVFDVDEAVFAEATREMVETGDWITPTYNYTTRYDKPILFYWLMAVAYKVFGINEFSARFWSATLGLGLVLMTYLFARSVLGPRPALVSAFILASCLEMIVLAHSAITDMTLTFFSTVSLFSFFLACHAQEVVVKKWWYRVCFLGMALAVLTKGLVGIVLPCLVILPFLFLTGRLKGFLKEPGLVSGGLLFLVVALPWYLLEFSINGQEFFQAFFVKHHFARYTGVVSGHRGPFYYFLLVILIGFFPWSAFLPAALVEAFSKERSILKTEPAIMQIRLFSVIWFGVILVFFSFSQTKLPNYVAPLFPAMALLVGPWWVEKASVDRSVKLSCLLLALVSFLLAAVLSLTPFLIEWAKSRFPSTPYLLMAPDLGIGPWLMALELLLGIGAGIRLFISFKKPFAFGIIVTTVGVFIATLLATVLPVVSNVMQGPLYEYAKRASTQLASGERLMVYGLNKPSVVFYAQRPAIILMHHNPENLGRLKEHLRAQERFYVITKTSVISELQGEPGFFVLDQRGGYALASNKPAT